MPYDSKKKIKKSKRELPDNYRPALAEDVPEGRACGNCIFFNESKQNEDGTQAWCEQWEEFVDGGYYCNAWEPQEEENKKRWSNVNVMINQEAEPLNKVERRVKNDVEFELRLEPESSDGMRFTGYAAVFNSESEPLPFTERINPGAFSKSLRSRNEVKMFMNHNMDHVLASTRSKTLNLKEDSTGLLAEAVLPDTSVGRDLATLMKRGDVHSMSFGFSVPSGGDKWSPDGSVRELREVRLHEVSIVTGFPAYEATTASVRSLDVLSKRTSVDADQLADLMLKLEAGETLPAEEADLLLEVVTKLRDKTEEVKEDLENLDIKRKELDLLFKAV
jgi:HK97 family phage prohead protease